jgi:hypothetical protein
MRIMRKLDPYVKPRVFRLSRTSLVRLRQIAFGLTSNRVGWASILAVVLLWPPITLVVFAFVWALIP